ncbi:MAG: hypothetical protein MUP11_10575 [Anaerolineales bacterium]|nr:hypothetical protein [Anaerolineales bacterium]
MNTTKSPLQRSPVSWIGIGLAIGAGVGIALDNLAVGAGLGAVFGGLISIQQSRKMNAARSDNEKEIDQKEGD